MAAILVASAAIAQNLPRLLGQAVPDCGPQHGAGKFQAYEGTTDLLGGIRAAVTRGHTPGHSVFVVRAKARRCGRLIGAPQAAPEMCPEMGLPKRVE